MPNCCFGHDGDNLTQPKLFAKRQRPSHLSKPPNSQIFLYSPELLPSHVNLCWPLSIRLHLLLLVFCLFHNLNWIFYLVMLPFRHLVLTFDSDGLCHELFIYLLFFTVTNAWNQSNQQVTIRPRMIWLSCDSYVNGFWSLVWFF